MNLTSIVLSGENILHNIGCFQRLVGSGKLCAVIKANAYGHGLKEIISLIETEVDYFQLDDIEELRAIRQWTKIPVLVFGYIMECDFEETIDLNGIPVVFKESQLSIINDIGRKNNKRIPVHIEMDVLLGRLGVPEAEGENFLKSLEKYPFVDCKYIYAHFSDIEDSDNLSQAKKQHELLLNVIKDFPFHISATSGILTDPENNWDGGILRLGIGLYGLWPSAALQKRWKDKIILKPVLSWKTKVAQVKMLPANYPVGYGQTFMTKRETKIAIIPQGYSDGYDRKFSNKSDVLIGGFRCPVIGRIAMNMFTVDASSVADVQEGDEVILIGEQGKEKITAGELASKIDTINYEMVARISPLLPRLIN